MPNVEVLDKKIDNYTVLPKTTDEQVVYSKIIPGGILNIENYLRLTTQWSRFSIGSITSPQQADLIEVDLFDNVSGGLRTSWSHVGSENNKEVIYQAMLDFSGPTYKLYKVFSSGPNSGGVFTEIPRVPMPLTGGDSFFTSHQRVGVSDQPAYSWWYLFNNWSTFLLPNSNKQVLVSATGRPPGWVDNDMSPWTIFGDSVYGITAQSSLTPNPLRGLHEYSINQTYGDGSALRLNFSTTVFDGLDVSWCYALHATANWLYALVQNSVTLTDHILKLDKTNYAVIADYDLGLPFWTQAFYVVNDNLIYFVNQTANNSPVLVGAWVGGDSGHIVVIDDAVENATNHLIFVNNFFPSYVTLGYQVLNGIPYLYVGSDGQNGNITAIRKIQLAQQALSDCE